MQEREVRRASKILLAIGACAAVALSACGGGGAGGATTVQATYDLQAGYVNLLAMGLVTNVSLSGTLLVNGMSTPFVGTGTLALAPAVSALFGNVQAWSQTETISGSVTTGGPSAPYSYSVTYYYSIGTYAVLGQASSGEYDVVQVPYNYPNSLATEPNGLLGTANRYTDSTLSVALGTSQTGFAVTLSPVDPGSPIQVQFTTNDYDTQNTLTEADVYNYLLSGGNVLSFVSATAQTSSGTLTVTAQ